MGYMRLGDLLTSVGRITQEQLAQALDKQRGSGRRLGQVLIEEGFLREHELIETLEVQLGIDFIDLSQIQIPLELASVVPQAMAKRYSVVPVHFERDELVLAMADPLNFVALEDVRAASRKRIQPRIATTAAVERAIAALYGNEGAARAMEEMRRENRDTGIPETRGAEAEELESATRSAPTVRLVNSILERAVSEHASDIPLEPRSGGMTVRMRMDGLLRQVLQVPAELQGAVLARLKVMAGLNTAERRLPQDGRARVRIRDRDIDLRLSTLPALYGEKAVVRILDREGLVLEPESLGLEGDNLIRYQALLQNVRGMILVVGPTGSGKTSTLYTMLQALQTEQVNVVTLEDPVEYQLDGITQVQIREKTGLTFAGGLRAVLRQDPDIIAVGEIRDGETARIALRAAITGHLVLSTVHTNDALSALDRLQDIGAESWLLGEALNGILSQRLVRRICPECREQWEPPEDLCSQLDLPMGTVLYRGRGCPHCYHTGYRGRIGIFELLVLNRRLKRVIAAGRSREDLEEILNRESYTSMEEGARRLVRQGITTGEEVLRVLRSTAG